MSRRGLPSLWVWPWHRVSLVPILTPPGHIHTAVLEHSLGLPGAILQEPGLLLRSCFYMWDSSHPGLRPCCHVTHFGPHTNLVTAPSLRHSLCAQCAYQGELT